VSLWLLNWNHRGHIYEATIDVKNFFKHTFVLTPAAPMNWFTCPLLFDMKLSCKNIVSDTSVS
jgi:hypothetical protein